MLDIQSIQSNALAYVSGIALHIVFFSRGEWDLAIPRLVGLFGALQLALLAYVTLRDDYGMSLRSAAPLVAGLGCSLIAGITTSMVVYRLLLHRLNQFPGPKLARLSNFYVTSLSAKNLRLFEEVEKLHQQYGDFVRLGPSELSIAHPDAATILYSAQAACAKGPFYNILHPRYSLQTLRDHNAHSLRRRYWDRGFSTKALRDYEPRVSHYTSLLLSRISQNAGKPLNMALWFNFYSFDVMGDLSFGKSFNMLRDGTKHYFMTALHADVTSIGYCCHLPWLFPFVKITPFLNAQHLAFWRFLSGLVRERKKMAPERPDIFSWVLKYFEETPKTAQAKLDVEADAYLIVVAGSDTTSCTLATLFFHLAQSPTQIQLLRQEIDPSFNTSTTVPDFATLAKSKHLDALINEALRLHPPVPSGVQRVTPANGLSIGGTWIPGESIVSVPLHTIFRDPRNFKRPTEFIPERWTTQPDLVPNPSCFIPFLTGAYSCPGKQLAFMELRYVTAQIVHKYDVSLAPDQTAEAFVEGKRDTFTLVNERLNLVFTPRKI